MKNMADSESVNHAVCSLRGMRDLLCVGGEEEERNVCPTRTETGHPRAVT